MFRKLAVAVLSITLLSVASSAQNANEVNNNASKAMGAEGLNSITYSGSASNGNLGQSRTIGGPLQMTAITSYTRAIDLTKPASRATGPTMPPMVPGGAPPQPGNFNQNITPADSTWTQQLEIWITPWGFLKGAAANNATVKSERIGGKKYDVVTWMTPQKSPSGLPYRVNGYINDQKMVERVETWVDHPILGDLHVDTTYSNYQDFGGLKVPTKILQTRADLTSFEATITSASANPANIAELLTPPPPAAQGGRGGGAGGAAAPPTPVLQSQKLAEGVYRITGPYVSMAIEFKDHIVVLEGAQNEARGLAVIAETHRLFPNKPIKYVVNTHAHFDHSGGLAPFVAEGITIITHENNKKLLEKAFSAPRTLVGDTLAKANKKPKVESVGEKKVLKDDTRTIELHHIQPYAHTDGNIIAFLPKEKILFTADFNVPAAGQAISPFNKALAENVERLNLDFDSHVIVHMPNPDRPLTKADLLALVKQIN